MNDLLRILFIDDDPAWLNALRRSTHRSRPEWELRFASSGQQALELMDREAVDVVVTDLNMPGLRGDALLSRIAEDHPDTLRFMLSGAGDGERELGSQRHAMEFIPKGISANELLSRVERGVALRRFMRSRVVDRLAETVGRLGDVPDFTMKIVSLADRSESAGRCVEISCPELGLEFRSLLPCPA
ncbi:MAG: response regulator [Planctomycetaceae bacterium]